MQVLLALADADGAVLTRHDLEQECWHGQIVGEDALNRAIFALRRAVRSTDAGFAIETIPRIGYRLKVERPENGASAPGEPRSHARRWLIVGGAAAAVAGGVGLWTALRPGADPRVAALLEQSRRAMDEQTSAGYRQSAAYSRQALAIDPDSAEVWGLLAIAYVSLADNAPPGETTAAARIGEQAADRALALDRGEPNALVALARLRMSLDDWIVSENRLREILARAPDTLAAMTSLTYFLQGVGRSRESWMWNERTVALQPLAPGPRWRKALKLWIVGRPDEAGQVIERAHSRWPQHALVWNARLVILAFTGRARAALTVIEGDPALPSPLPPDAVPVWRASLTALDTRRAADIAAAREANLGAAPKAPGLAAYAVMTLSALNEIDAAFAVAEGFLLRQGPLVGSSAADGSLVKDPGWRRTQWLFTPATAPLRADPRFAALCDGVGLTDYWRRRRVRPDFMIRQS